MSTPLLTTKRIQRLPALTLACGATLDELAIGYETYGQLNAARDNAILVCHFFSGCSHAAGRYTPDDLLPGWWDAVIGPGKAIDTDRYYVIASDAVGCVRLDAPHGVTTGPASLNPATGRPFGPDFPAVTVADMVAAQRLLLDALGVERLAAVAGPSLGAMQAMEWAVSRPQDVDRVIAAIGLTSLAPRERALYLAMAETITLDPAFAAGRYAPGTPLPGLAAAVAMMMALAGGRGMAGAPTDPDAFAAWLAAESRLRASACDANSWVALLRANMRWRLGNLPLDEAARRITARVLLVPGRGDELLPMADYHDPLVDAFARAGREVMVAPLPATGGHLAGLGAIAHAATAIRRCLDTPVVRVKVPAEPASA